MVTCNSAATLWLTTFPPIAQHVTFPVPKHQNRWYKRSVRSRVAYTYDKVGNRASVTYPDLKVIRYGYDAANRLSQVKDWSGRAFTYSYDAANNRTGIAYPNTTAAAALTYDAANRLTKIIHSKNGSAFRTLAYALDAAGNRTSVIDNGIGSTFAYNTLNELASATRGGATSSWTYDNAGNRLQEVAPTGTTAYTYDANDRMLTAGNLSFSYDANGNLTTKLTPSGNTSFTFNAANRLTSVAGPEISSTFAYDGDGNRINQNTTTGAYTYVNDLAAPLATVLAEAGPDGNIDYGYNGLNALESSSIGFNYFYHGDALGSVVDLTNTAGTINAAYSYDAWGNALSATGTVGTKNKFRFTGQALDPGTGLYFLRARYYDSTSGRLMGKDPFPGLLPCVRDH